MMEHGFGSLDWSPMVLSFGLPTLSWQFDPTQHYKSDL
jgi:hypothetical protein